MSLFGSSLASHIAQKLDIPVEDIIEALESFSGDTSTKKKVEVQKKTKTSVPPPKKQATKEVPPPKKEAPPSKKPVKNEDTKTNEKHTCERVKKGQTEKCGKNAMRFIEDGNKKRWYCGTEKAGCYLSELNVKAKKDSEKEAIPANTKTASTKKSSSVPKTNTDRKLLSENKSKSLVQTVIKQLDILPKKVNGKTIHMEKVSRALIDPQTREFYGILDEDNQTILPLDAKTIKMIESSGHTIRQEKVVKTQHKSRETHGTATTKKVPEPEAVVESVDSSDSLSDVKDEEISELSDISDISDVGDDSLEISDEVSDGELEITNEDAEDLEISE
jgi:hypothetical protein